MIDAALIACAQRVEHYEMAGYGCVRTFAALLGYEDSVVLLQETLDEEGAADKALSELAETVINPKAEESDMKVMETKAKPTSKTNPRKPLAKK